MSELSLVKAVAGHLAGNGLGVWRDGAPYAATDEWPIYVMTMPETGADKVITLTPYAVADTPTVSTSVIGVQVRYRGTRDPKVVLDKADAVFDLLHGAAFAEMGPVYVAEVVRTSSAMWGLDQNGRWERSDNYYFTVHRPSRNRT